ncbi:hypothetical protein GLAREA_03941 [Glarea lozoyensis ATCC 20868]|uniref:Uncharacterized protein n=1 Tax=Glarea lozoyensis (strain ATCC 20868 / MF5171) TaxID=1116229 RepID=S3D1D1_GLAL2|nr:uncharacterized protein GLAREA_03941 [Glarea lozoyensis ATCC 20868]EPE30974.1 hypothetical protein GLAREA_03941 [Glarea lozoyensis ATCC 20868]
MKLSNIASLLAALPLISALAIDVRTPETAIPRPTLKALKACEKNNCKQAVKAWSECQTYTTKTRPSETMQQCLCGGPNNLDGLWHYEWYSALVESCAPCVEEVVTPGDTTLSTALGLAAAEFCSGGDLTKFTTAAKELENVIFPFSLPEAVFCHLLWRNATHPIPVTQLVAFGPSVFSPPILSISGIAFVEFKVAMLDLVEELLELNWGTSASDCASCINTAANLHLDAFGLIQPYCFLQTDYQKAVDDLKAGVKKQTVTNKSSIEVLSFTAQDPVGPQGRACLGGHVGIGEGDSGPWGDAAYPCTQCINDAIGSHLSVLDLLVPYCSLSPDNQALKTKLNADAHQQTVYNNSPIEMLRFVERTRDHKREAEPSSIEA